MLEEDIGKRINRLSNLIKRKIDKEISKDNDLTKNQSLIIDYLNNNKKIDIYQKNIEELLSIRRSTATEILNLMEKKGLLTRKNVKEDARLKKLVLTKKGLEQEQKNHYKIARVENKIASCLTKKEIKSLNLILSKIENKLIETKEEKWYGKKIIKISKRI